MFCKLPSSIPTIRKNVRLPLAASAIEAEAERVLRPLASTKGSGTDDLVPALLCR